MAMEREKAFYPKEKDSGDVIDIETDQFFREFTEDLDDLKKADAALQILLHSKMINSEETIALVSEKITERIDELEETLKALKSRGFVRENNKSGYRSLFKSKNDRQT
ncbi:MAG: hypothetical protein A2915_01450 [Candidatus Yanofskybacteria bacterium RIFCSPLOWO2_01_FULL_41_34]|uniref:Uncharacterized protein n=1 Tax=Candidatus Yanofskybacteria bacterium RIFCSPHIGHO2_01_FULL_41_26 TaxID=1802661 RepID=A0A1F8ECN7_9BACT|nr:MAG: hypothetical protein A2649_01925 [Candidatus Yanofskybacteria bacterium RIFCSPHIGHO2_01_FULL_41_26]OGN21895.1 MAG: hypothetical protein A2915_01450 [Candidatus Yanofskybacteria bacterium RIFCSPLOWO2_01_FULL_41_34]